MDKKIIVKQPNIQPYNKVIHTVNNVNVQHFLDLYFKIKISPETYNKIIKQ